MMTSNDLALVHIGMMLAEYDADYMLPETSLDAQNRIYNIFGVEWDTSAPTIRNKMEAIIEKLDSPSIQ